MGKIITLDPVPFNPSKEKYLGRGWKIDEPEDPNYLALSEFDLSKIVLKHTINKGENSINGEERLRRLKAKKKFIRLGARAFFFFKQNPHLIPENWKERDKNGSLRYIYFDGTILLSPNLHRCSFFIYWIEDRWRGNMPWLDNDPTRNFLSVLLPVSEAIFYK